MGYKRVVVGADFSMASVFAVEIALDLSFASGGTLYLVHVIETIAVDLTIGPMPLLPSEWPQDVLLELEGLIPELNRNLLFSG